MRWLNFILKEVYTEGFGKSQVVRFTAILCKRCMVRKLLISVFVLLQMMVFSLSFAAENAPKQAAPPITAEEMAKASVIYFDRCAGCHGMLRKGATGSALTPDKSIAIGTENLKIIMDAGLPGGMPDWGKQGVMSPADIDLVARFIQHEPPSPPEMTMEQMKKSLKVTLQPASRPSKPEHSLNWQNFMGVVLRDTGKVAIIDGDTKKLVSIVDTGFAVHILRSSASGRFFYSIGRDGKVTLIDLWLKTPDKVAEVKTCYDARSIETSKYKGKEGDFIDKLAIVGCYWPSSMVVLNGETLEPMKVVSTSSYTYDTNEFLREARVASIVAAPYDPIWVVNIKESGQTWLVNYSDLKNMKISMIETERFLHDGGWDSTKRYFLVAANMRNKVAVVDTVEGKLTALVETGVKPHPGRGANIEHPTYGPIWCTGHLGENTVACIGTDPKKHPQHAWKVVKKIKLPGEGGGNLFVKTHPSSTWMWADRTLNPDVKLQRSIFAIDKKTLEVVKTIELPEKHKGRAVHFEFDKDGKEVWVSAWGKKTEPSAILVYDDKTFNLVNEITGDWVRTPTGHFNVHNTTFDVY
ncbi:cytochrome cd1 nitrite reductase [Candidatus Magnetobacterium bavaricum]|uniref:Cytochrome cd1 nitrite reductase n=1 Tax=Candidatus Magnetobacterium bavaricum TaxID=29290 RepID=A0A0F3GT58_9BACT|nr:cytochrome cd1 nitrite reductase [Candidatus Magnetobacterium bavaricum]